MDVYSQGEQRAHGTGFVGIEAESDDQIDALEVYEALINPRESGNQSGGSGGPGMMPPMMGMGGAGGGAASAQATGLSQGMAGNMTGAAARMVTPVVPGALPSAQTGAASAGVGAAGLGGGIGGGGGGLGSGPIAAGALAEQPADALGEGPADDPAAADPAGGEQTDPGQQPAGDVGPSPRSDIIQVDPVEVERVAREWADLSAQMSDVGSYVSELQAGPEDFGLMPQPAGAYGDMTSGFTQLAASAAKEFEEISAALAHGAKSYRDQESAATQQVGKVQ